MCFPTLSAPFFRQLSSADLLLFRVPLPFALSPPASSSESPRLFCSCCPVLRLPEALTCLILGRSLLRPAFWGLQRRLQPIPCGQRSYFCLSETSSLGQEVTNFLAKSSQEHLLKGKKKKRKHTSDVHDDFLTFNWPCPQPVMWLKADELLLVTEAQPVSPTQTQGVGCGRG